MVNCPSQVQTICAVRAFWCRDRAPFHNRGDPYTSVRISEWDQSTMLKVIHRVSALYGQSRVVMSYLLLILCGQLAVGIWTLSRPGSGRK